MMNQRSKSQTNRRAAHLAHQHIDGPVPDFEMADTTYRRFRALRIASTTRFGAVPPM